MNEEIEPSNASSCSTERCRSDGHQHPTFLGEYTELIFACLCGTSLLVGWLLSFSQSSETVPWLFYLAAYLFGGFFITQEAIEQTLKFNFEIDFLMIIAAIGAGFLGAWAEGALLLFLFSLGHALEHYAMGRARKAIESLADLTPSTAWVRKDDTIAEVPIEALEIGDTVIVKPNERLAADGFVVKGESSIDQSPITGESIPVDKVPVVDRTSVATAPENLRPESRVFAGTINQSGLLEVEVTRLANDSALARVVTMVNEAESQKSPTQLFTDRFEKYFVPLVIGVVIALHFAFLVIDESFGDSFYRAMAVLVAASPCALAIATPSAVLSAVARAARGGVLVKGGGPLENLGTLKSIAFDKTGTLTEGNPRLTDTIVFGNINPIELLTVVIAVESLSDHPLAAAVTRDATEKLSREFKIATTEEATDLQSITGRGVRAMFNDQPVLIGKPELFAESTGPRLSKEALQQIEQLEHDGRTTMTVRLGDRYLGVLGMMDTPRAAAKDVVQRLRDLGVEQLVMISGDNQNVADAVAKSVGIDTAMGNLMPEDKVAAIKRLSESGGVAMLGDGVNDAPAMATATVGVAMGAAGSDVALETADVALMADDLRHLPFAVGLSRQTSRIIRQNLWFALGMVAVLVPATVLGLKISFAVLFHEGSTILVVVNALRLLVYREK